MYRICMASSGYYYVQEDMGSTWHPDWVKVGGFFNTRAGARRFIRDRKGYLGVARKVKPQPRVIEYY